MSGKGKPKKEEEIVPPASTSQPDQRVKPVVSAPSASTSQPDQVKPVVSAPPASTSQPDQHAPVPIPNPYPSASHILLPYVYIGFNWCPAPPQWVHQSQRDLTGSHTAASPGSSTEPPPPIKKQKTTAEQPVPLLPFPYVYTGYQAPGVGLPPPIVTTNTDPGPGVPKGGGYVCQQPATFGVELRCGICGGKGHDHTTCPHARCCNCDCKCNKAQK